MSQARALYHVQEIELSIIERHKRIKEIDLLLEDDELVKEAQAELEDSKVRFEEIKKQVTDLELQIEAVVNKQKATENRLYSGNVKNPKELQDMQAELEALSRRHNVLDDQLLDLMENREQAKSLYESAHSTYQEIQSEWESEHQDLLTEKEQLKTEAEQSMQERKKAIASIDPQTFKTYNSLRTTKANRPIALIEDKTCTVCGIEQNGIIVSAINRDDTLVYCQNCGRILVRI